MTSAQRILCFVLARLPDSVDARHAVLTDLMEVWPEAREPRRLLVLLDQHLAAQRELVFDASESAERGHRRLGDRPINRGSGRLGDKTATRVGGQ